MNNKFSTSKKQVSKSIASILKMMLYASTSAPCYVYNYNSTATILKQGNYITLTIVAAAFSVTILPSFLVRVSI
jgi:hypothetical protein